MTKKDYELIARKLNDIAGMYDLHTPQNSLLWTVADNLADGFKKQNPRFNRLKFLQACGLE